MIDETAPLADDRMQNRSVLTVKRPRELIKRARGRHVFPMNQLVASAILTALAFAPSQAISDTSEIVHADAFDEGLDNWIVEQQEGGRVYLESGKMVIEDESGCTVWFKKELHAPVKISYEVTVSSEARVSDMNCFWMASDPDHPHDLFAEGHGREGAFAQYDDLQLYYVGYGGNHNSTTRFRRYLGKGEKPLLPDFDKTEESFLLVPDHTYKIELVADEEGAKYYRDGELIFEYDDPDPLTRGWFGFRTVWSKLLIDNFKVESL